MSPSLPRWMSSPSLRTGGLNTKVWPTMSVRPVRWASCTSSSASAVELVIGFSTNTCLPASQRRLGEREVRGDRRGDDHRVHGGVGEHLVVALRGGLRRVAAADLVERLRRAGRRPTSPRRPALPGSCAEGSGPSTRARRSRRSSCCPRGSCSRGSVAQQGRRHRAQAQRGVHQGVARTVVQDVLEHHVVEADAAAPVHLPHAGDAGLAPPADDGARAGRRRPRRAAGAVVPRGSCRR